MGKKTKLGKFRKDKFYKLAKETGFRSRAAFKLIQLNRRFGFLQPSQVCIDLCAAPGGWMQVAKQNMPVSSIVIGVDLYPIRPIPGCISIVEDITTEKCKKALTNELKTWKADVILHDGAPNVGKNWLYDAYQQICLTLNALKLATNFLKGGGWFVTKIFRSKDYNALLWVLKQLFKKVHATKPSASRKESAEIFVVCQGYLSPDKIDARLLDAKYVFEELDLENGKQASLLHPDKQKRIKAEGYTEKDILLRNELLVTDFMESANGLAALQGVSSIKMNHEGVKNHPRTTKEILECCKDLKLLGRKDIKGLLNWWKHIRDDIFKKTEKPIESIKEKDSMPKEHTVEEIEDMELEELDRKVVELAAEETQEIKRKRKKLLKQRKKLNEKMNLKMVLKGDDGPREQLDDEVFELKQIKTQRELETLQDTAPELIVENEEMSGEPLPKYIRYLKNDQVRDDDGTFDKNSNEESEISSESESDYEKEGLGLSDGETTDKNNIKKNKKKLEEHPLIKSSDYRDKDTKRKQRVQLWFEKENLQNLEAEDDEDYDLDRLADEYKSKGVKFLGEERNEINKQESAGLGKRAKLKAKHLTEKEESLSDSSSDSEEDGLKKSNGAENGTDSKLTKTKKIRLTENELALGAMMVKSRKTKRDLIDAAWNRYTFNDDGLPPWFVEDENQHMRRVVPVPKELADEYENKVRELNVRPIKKVMEAKARKKRRALKRLQKAKKKAEQILENVDFSAQEKMKQIKKLYKKVEDKKKEITYVVSKKHLAGKRVRRPPGVKGRFKVVDPRMKKDKRSVIDKQKKSKSKKKK